MQIDYSSSTDQPPRKRSGCGVPLLIAALVIGLVFVFFCSGLSFPIMGGAANDLAGKLSKDFRMTLPASAVVDHGSSIAYRDPSYFYAVHMTPADLQSFINGIRATATAAKSLEERRNFDIVGPPPPSWFATSSVTDLTTFDVTFAPDHTWRLGYSPSTGKLFIEWMSF